VGGDHIYITKRETNKRKIIFLSTKERERDQVNSKAVCGNIFANNMDDNSDMFILSPMTTRHDVITACQSRENV